MCGIYGVIALRGAVPEVALLDRMGRALTPRGPDGHGRRVRGPAALGATRLRIVDPGPQSDQPFTDPGENVWLVCNGEIYNASELRARFAAYPYRSRSDVEPILPLFLSKGTRGLAELDGMFALAIWDARHGELVLARDRAGEKPLFVAADVEGIAFASEIEALLAVPSLRRDRDPRAQRDFLALGYVREPHTPFRAIRKVRAGTIEVLRGCAVTAHRYWHPEAIAVQPWRVSDAEQALDDALDAAVRRQIVADAPLGAFVSGGVDSSLLAVLAHRAGRELALFAVGFEAAGFDETGWAARLAAHLGLPLTTIRVGEADLSSALDALVCDLAEPLGDPAALPTWLLARRAAQTVRCVLSGEGADELFGGYPTYVGHVLAPWWCRLPEPVRALVRAALRRVPSTTGNVPLEYLLKRFVDGARLAPLERHLAWFGTGLTAPAAADLSSEWPPTLLDYVTYLRDGLLVKIDRTTMRHSLEARAPYLDRGVTELAFSLPPQFKVRRLTTKWLLKRVAIRYLPRAIVARRKRGLGVPIARWINRGLRADVDRLLAPDRLATDPTLDAARVSTLLEEHRSGRVNHARALWPLVMWNKWAEHWL